jgi:hypothetical protein
MSLHGFVAGWQPFAITVSKQNRKGDKPCYRHTKPHYSGYVDKFRIFQ